MFKITGIENLQKNLNEAERVLGELDGTLGVINFDSNDPTSIEAAIQSVNRMVDERMGAYSANPVLAPLAEQMKEKYRESILQKAAESRLGSNKGE